MDRRLPGGHPFTIAIYPPMCKGHLTIWVCIIRYLSSFNSTASDLYSTIAPEYVLDEQLVTASDMYSLGCLIYAVHNKASPPFKNHNNPASLRENAGRIIPGLDRLEPDLRGVYFLHAALLFAC